MFLPAVPSSPGPLATNAAVLNHLSNVGWSIFGLPTRFGRWLTLSPLKALSLLDTGLTANPLAIRMMGETCQLPASFCSNGETNFGLAKTNEPLKLCRI